MQHYLKSLMISPILPQQVSCDKIGNPSECDSLLQLPVELHLRIVDHLDTQCDKAALMSCSRLLYQLLASRVFRTIVVRSPARIDRFLDYVWDHPQFAEHVRSLHIRPHIFYDEFNRDETRETREVEWFYNFSQNRRLHDALSRLVNLETLAIPDVGVMYSPRREWDISVLKDLALIPNVAVYPCRSALLWFAVRDDGWANEWKVEECCESQLWKTLVNEWRPKQLAHL